MQLGSLAFKTPNLKENEAGSFNIQCAIRTNFTFKTRAVEINYSRNRYSKAPYVGSWRKFASASKMKEHHITILQENRCFAFQNLKRFHKTVFKKWYKIVICSSKLLKPRNFEKFYFYSKISNMKNNKVKAIRVEWLVTLSDENLRFWLKSSIFLNFQSREIVFLQENANVLIFFGWMTKSP